MIQVKGRDEGSWCSGSKPRLRLKAAAGEFIAIFKKLERVLREKRKLRREILDAQAAQNTLRVAGLRAHCAALERDPDDFQAISAQQREAYARCR